MTILAIIEILFFDKHHGMNKIRQKTKNKNREVWLRVYFQRSFSLKFIIFWKLTRWCHTTHYTSEIYANISKLKSLFKPRLTCTFSNNKSRITVRVRKTNKFDLQLWINRTNQIIFSNLSTNVSTLPHFLTR